MHKLDGHTVKKAITIPITTRSMGFGTAMFFRVLSNFSSDFSNVPVPGDIYQMYRVSLAILEVKTKICQRGIIPVSSVYEDYARLAPSINEPELLNSGSLLPDYITSTINAIGKVNVGDRLYAPHIGRNNYTPISELFIPQSEQVTYSNLRLTVSALANERTPVEYRQGFYQNNPIPGAIWRNVSDKNPILVNPDDIMPEGDTHKLAHERLTEDIFALHSKITFLRRKAPQYFSTAVNFGSDGTRAMLVCNRQEDLRIADRKEGELLVHYYRRIKIEGDVTDYFNLVTLNGKEQVDGCVALLGEVPSLSEPTLEYPVYITRNERGCCEYSSGLSYKTAICRSKYNRLAVW